MSRGSPILQLRVSQDFILALDVAIDEMNRRRPRKTVTRTSFIFAAIQEKLRHMERSKKSRRKRCNTPEGNERMAPPTPEEGGLPW